MHPENHPDNSFFNDRTIRVNRDVMLKRARAIVKNDADAEDVVQEAFERAWRSRAGFISGANPRPWLLKITTNAAIDLVQRQLPLDNEGAEAAAALDAPEVTTLQRETVRSIEIAVADLAPAQRAAFVLHDVQGYSSREISVRQRMPYHTVRTHLFRARRQLRRALSGVES